MYVKIGVSTIKENPKFSRKTLSIFIKEIESRKLLPTGVMVNAVVWQKETIVSTKSMLSANYGAS